ncbi:MAG: O-antigen ligase family protein [Erysipelotrichaceae bacterium]
MLNKWLKRLVSTLFIILPIIEMLRNTQIKNIEIFNISLIELIVIVLILSALVLTIIKHKYKFSKWLFLIVLIYASYLLWHCYHIYSFDQTIFPLSDPSYFVELYYLFRVYLLPLLLILILIENKDVFDKHFYLVITKYLILVISANIVVCNLARFSLFSYKYEDATLINTSCFFDVFTVEKNYQDLFTCGFFPSANQISIVLVMLLPLNLLSLYRSVSLSNVLLVVLQLFAMIIVGTKTAVLGSLLELLAGFILYIGFLLLPKERPLKKNYLAILIILMVLTSFTIYLSPFYRNYTSNKTSLASLSERQKYIYQQLNELPIEAAGQFIKENYGTFKINKIFCDLYPIENDPAFWLEIAKRDRSLNNDYRIIKQDILARIAQRNDNPLDKYLGLGYSLNFPDIERDYVYQYYLFGIFGVILFIGSYIIIYIYNLFKAFYKVNFNYYYALALVSCFFGFVVCYFSGHLFGWSFPMYIMALCLCYQREDDYCGKG